MITLSDSPSPSPSKHDSVMPDYEPDEEWKTILRSRLHSDMQAKLAEVKEDSFEEMRRSSTPGPEDRRRMEAEFRNRMTDVREKYSDQYQIELEKERNKRRWIAGAPMAPGWMDYLEKEQQHAFDSFKRSRDQPVAPSHLQETVRSLSRASLRGARPMSTSFPTDVPEMDVEPPEEWKAQLKTRIKLGFQPKAIIANDKRTLALGGKKMVSAEERQRIDDDYENAMASIRDLADDEFNFELDKERRRRQEELIKGDKDAEEASWKARSHSEDEDSLLMPPSRSAGRRESPASQSGRDGGQEPDETWKARLHARIHEDLKSMVREANDTHFIALRNVADAFAKLEYEHKAAMDKIQEITQTRFEDELAKERLRRRSIGATDGLATADEEDEEGSEEEEHEDAKDESDEADAEEDQRIIEEREEREREKRETEVRWRERDNTRREIEARKKHAQAKLMDPEEDEIDIIKKNLKDAERERVKWKDLEVVKDDDDDDDEDDSELAPVPPPEGGDIKPDGDASGIEKARRKQQEIDDQFRDYESENRLNDDLFDDPKWKEEQSYIWQQLQYQLQAEQIQRKRQEQRQRQDSMGSSGDGGSYGSPSSSPATSKMHMQPPAQIPVIPQMPPVNRSHVPVTPWTPVSSLSLAAAAANKAAAVPPSPTIPRKPSFMNQMGININTGPGSNSMSIPKPRTGSFTSNALAFDHPGPSPSPRNVPIIAPANNLYARVAMVKTRSTSAQDSPQ